MPTPPTDPLLAVVEDKCSLFHDEYDAAFADLEVDSHRETWPVRSQQFQLWIQHKYFRKYHRAPSPVALNSALDTLEAQARFEGAHRQVFCRVGALDSGLFLDLGNREWQAVETDAHGWRVVDRAPARFTRSQTTRSLPTPQRGGRVDDLRAYLNVGSDDDFALVQAWLVAALRSAGPYPVLVLQGEQGSAKSWAARILRALIDPHEAPLRTAPRSERDLFVTARNSHVLALDNLSTMPVWLSDALCRLSTGGGFSTRRLYTDTSELVVSATRR